MTKEQLNNYNLAYINIITPKTLIIITYNFFEKIIIYKYNHSKTLFIKSV